jgi:hypothetical protein
VFGRRRKQDGAADADVEDDLDLAADPAADEDRDADAPARDTVVPATIPRPMGPWDIEDMPRDDVERVDLGGLMVPVSGGHELRVDVDPTTSAIIGVTLSTPTTVMQVAGFAAPRTGGIWQEIREEIAGSLTADGGSSQEEEGPYGRELRANLPADESGQRPKARFLGVDGPRWFVRAMIQGQGASDLDAEPGLLAAFGHIVVNRGADAMAVRDALPLRLPADVAAPVAEAVEQAAAAPEQERTYELPDRGPLNTETR